MAQRAERSDFSDERSGPDEGDSAVPVQ